MLEEIDHAVGVAPLIVIPRYNLEEPLFAGQVVLGGGKGIIDGGIAVVDEVGRHKVLSAAAKMGFSTWCFSVGPYGPIWAPPGPTLKHHLLKPILAAADRIDTQSSDIHNQAGNNLN